MQDLSAELRARINGETGKIRWNELERHFARGNMIWVSGELDLVEVAVRITEDDKAAVEQWMRTGAIRRAEAEDAKSWQACNQLFWAVVTAPWLLVQEIDEA